MKIGNFETDEEVMVVAEIGNNHEGSYARAEEMIGLAAEAGASAVKFQTIHPEHLVRTQDEARFAMLKDFELSYDEFEKLSQVARDEQVIFLSTPFDLKSAEFLNGLVPAFKIASGDNTFYPLLEKIAEFGKPIMLSTGLVGMKQLAYSKSLIEKVWADKGIQQDIALLHCVCSYPTPPSNANLSSILFLRENFGGTIGYSDHTLGIEAAVISVALGARIIEKHFTLDRNFSDFNDHKLSVDPTLLKELVSRIGEVNDLIGYPEKQVQDCEIENRMACRRSIAAGRNIAADQILLWEDLVWLRPGGGLSPGREHDLIGKKALREIRAGEHILPGDVS
jgi:N,N'-diacetyllegionaminate synthase